MAILDFLANDYIRAALIMLFVLLVVRPFLFFLEKVVLYFTSKTETDLDDLLVKRAYKPVTTLIILIGLFIAVGELSLNAQAHTIVQNLIHSAIAIVVAYCIYAFFDVVIVHAIKRRAIESGNNTRKSLISLILSILRVIFFVLGLIYILTIWGVAIAPFIAGLGIAGLAVALALQPTLTNILAGMGMILDKTIKEGDQIYLDDNTKGTVHKIGMRSTKIISFDNDYIIVPNSKLAESKIQNITLPDPLARASVNFTVAYESDIAQVKKIVMNEIKAIEHVVESPAPIVHFSQMQDSALAFTVYYHVDSYTNRFGTIDEANTRIYNALRKNGIDIPFPQMVVHMSAKSNHKKTVSKSKKL